MQRYDLEQVNACYTTDHEMVRSDDGEWVRYEEAAASALDLLAALKGVTESQALDGVESLVNGWRGPAEKPLPEHPKNLGANVRTTCGRVYKLDAALRAARAAIAKAEGRS